MNILILSPEAGITTSPLTVAVNRMTEAFARVGAKALTCSPLYKKLIADLSCYTCIYRGTERQYNKPFEIWRHPDGLHTYVYNEEFFNRDSVYESDRQPYSDNHIRYSFLASAALEYAAATQFKPDAILGHEWGGALAGNLIRTVYAEYYAKVPFFFTIHNINYDFLVPETELASLSLNPSDYNMDGYEYWGKVSLLKAGICYAHTVLLPSIGYKDALLNKSAGGLTGFLRRNEKKLKGIQFGLNYKQWDFNLTSDLSLLEAKKKARAELAAKVGTDFGDKLIIYAHLDKESGNTSETLSTLLADLANQNAFVLVGKQGSFSDLEYYNAVAAEYPHSFCAKNIGSSPEELRSFLAGSDVLFASDLQEPSTSILLKALAAGTIPITGKDTGVAKMLTSHSEDNIDFANAFLTDNPNSPVLMYRSVKNCLEIYKTPVWNQMVQNAYAFRYEWDRTISQYLLTLGEISNLSGL